MWTAPPVSATRWRCPVKPSNCRGRKNCRGSYRTIAATLTCAASGMVSDDNRTASREFRVDNTLFVKLYLRYEKQILDVTGWLESLGPRLVLGAFCKRHAKRILSLLPVLVLLPALFGLRRSRSGIIPVILFFVWNPGLFHGEGAVPQRSLVLLLVTTSLNLPWFVLGWNDGLTMQGARYKYSVSTVNVVFIAATLDVIRTKSKDRAFVQIEPAIPLAVIRLASLVRLPILWRTPIIARRVQCEIRKV